MNTSGATASKPSMERAVAVTVEEVKMWATYKGVGHAVACANGYWVSTACNIFANFDQTTDRPKRICRKCRARLRDAVPAASSGKE